VGPTEALEAFLVAVKNEESLFDFDHIIPYPDHFKRPDALAQEWVRNHPDWPTTPGLWKERPTDGFNQGGYEWCIENWGTKWNAVRAVHAENGERWDENGREFLRVTISFDTAWSPPEPVILRASELHPALRFELRYFESGAGFNGIFVCQAGEVIEEDQGAYYGSRGG
jgi:hypothetical protein